MVAEDDANSSSSTLETITLNLGCRAQLTELFSYPNHPTHACPPTTVKSSREIGENKEEQQDTAMSLEQTIQHYLMTSMLRDGHVESTIQISSRQDAVYATISGKAAVPYSRVIPEFLTIGKLGLQACQQIQENGLWRDQWRFFLPLGLPLTQHWTVELLHFPPIYTLEDDQDYLASRSTLRWRQLLEINRGDPNAMDDLPVKEGQLEPTDRFQAIIDIVPIAAPSSDGKNMKDVYPYFEDYIRASLQFWVGSSSDPGVNNAHDAKPIVAFGWPVKCWVEANQAKRNKAPKIVETSEEEIPSNPLSVLSLARLPIESSKDDASLSAPVLIANHPSYLYNAGRRMTSNTIESLEEDDSTLLERIMTEDLIAARWQVEMGLDPSQDAQCVFKECCQFWRDSSRIELIHQLINKQAFILQVL